MGVNNWPIVIETFKELHDQHVIENENFKNDILLNVREFVKNDLMMCTLLST
jgi:hypothetical protein